MYSGQSKGVNQLGRLHYAVKQYPTMKALRDHGLKLGAVVIALGTMAALTGCSLDTLPRGAVGNVGLYNYSPSVIQSGEVRQLWWCSVGSNPLQHSQNADSIYYATINTTTQEKSEPVLVMAETPGAWDSAYTCNPKVVKGSFHNPLGDGQTYGYAMYYVGTANINGIINSIGVAFSNDGISWKKYPNPVVASTSQIGYGVGQPSPYNADQGSAITLFYEDDTPYAHHVAAVSSDGIHFTVQGPLTLNGLDADDPHASWGDIAYDSKAGEWYAVFNRPYRPPSTTGGVPEYAQDGIELYRIPQHSILTGASPWEQLTIIDTNTTGFEGNFIAGFVRDPYGNLDMASYPAIQMYTSITYPQPAWDASPAESANSAKITTWILLPMEWAPGDDAPIALTRYANATVHEVTTGWVGPDGDFQAQQILGHLYPNPNHGATVPFYGCKGGNVDYFVSLDIGCEGERMLGKMGYGYSEPFAGSNLIPLYRCSTSHDHFVSRDPKCEGSTTDELLGYALP
jgi:hypothetical protein